jgi:tRNA-modifying protein YgfZ
MSPRELSLGALFDLSGRTKLRVTGNDRLRFLNGQITNDVSKATDSSAIAACVLNAKGRINAYIFLFVSTNAVLIDADPELRESLPARFERYIISDDVQIEDVTDRFALFHILPDNIPKHTESAVSVNRFGQPGFDLLVETARHDETLNALSGEARFCDDLCTEILRIEQGIPRWGRELTEDIIPIEANLEGSCVDYEKGCYIGQEVISRMKMSGQRNKSLCGLVGAADSRLSPGMRLQATSMPDMGKEVGWITSAIHSERLGRMIALGFVKRGFNAVDSQLSAAPLENSSGTPSLPVRVVDLPFVSP